MGRNVGGWLIVGACVLVFAKCGGNTKPPSVVVSTPAPVVSRDGVDKPAPAATVLIPAAPASSPVSPTPRRQAGAILRPIKRSLYVTGKEVPMRAAPDGKAAILDRLPTGMQVGELTRREGWAEVRHPISAVEGWMSARQLSMKAPVDDDAEDEAPGARRKPTVQAPLDVIAIGAALIARSIASYPGSCPCPNNVDRGGRRCGGRSAHSRGGGRAPLCYQEDITPAMIANYRARGGR